MRTQKNETTRNKFQPAGLWGGTSFATKNVLFVFSIQDFLAARFSHWPANFAIWGSHKFPKKNKIRETKRMSQIWMSRKL